MAFTGLFCHIMTQKDQKKPFQSNGDSIIQGGSATTTHEEPAPWRP